MSVKICDFPIRWTLAGERERERERDLIICDAVEDEDKKPLWTGQQDKDVGEHFCRGFVGKVHGSKDPCDAHYTD